MDGTSNPGSPTVASLLNSTPIETLRYGADWSDQENWSWSLHHPPCYYVALNASGGADCEPITNNVTDFATLCSWLTTDDCILGLPAEINSPSTATYLLNWLKQERAWQPSCVAIGNEPSSWEHYTLPWNSWGSGDAYTPSALHLADTVLNYTDALRHMNSGICIIGLEASTNYAAGQAEISAISTLISNLTSYAFHLYPDNNCYTTDGLIPLLAVPNLTKIQTAYTDDFVPYSGGKPVAIHEFNMGESGCAIYMATYAGAVFTSAEVAQALALDVPEFTYFRFYCNGPACMFNSSGSGSPTPTFNLYAYLFTNMYINHIYNASVAAGATPETFAVIGGPAAVGRANGYSVLVSNAAPVNWEKVSLEGLLNATCLSTTMTAHYETPAKGAWNYTLASNNTIELPDQSTAVVDWGCARPPPSPSTNNSSTVQTVVNESSEPQPSPYSENGSGTAVPMVSRAVARAVGGDPRDVKTEARCLRSDRTRPFVRSSSWRVRTVTWSGRIQQDRKLLDRHRESPRRCRHWIGTSLAPRILRDL